MVVSTWALLGRVCFQSHTSRILSPNLWLLNGPVRWQNYYRKKLENVAITMYCHWGSPDAMPLLTQNVFWASDTRDLISMVTFTFTMRPTLFGSHQRHLFPPVWQRLVEFGFRVQRVGSTMRNLRRVSENSDPILSRLWTKVHEIFNRCRKPLVFSSALFRLSMSRFVQKIFAIKSQSRRKTEQMQFFGPQFLWEGRLQLFYGSLLRRLTTHYLAKFGWVPFADLRLLSLVMKQNAEFTKGG